MEIRNEKLERMSKVWKINTLQIS